MSAVSPFPGSDRQRAATEASPAAIRSESLSLGGKLFLSVFLIIVFEGAVRKWVSTSLSLPLIALRDVLVLCLILHAWRSGALRRQKMATSILLAWSCVVVAWGLFQLVGGQSTPVIMVIGLRFWLLYLWFAVAAAASMNATDFRMALRLAGCMLLVMAPLAVLQHLSPPGAFINAQTEGDEEGIFVVVAGIVRTTGTFSFTAGYSYFLSTVAPVALGILAARKRTSAQFVFAFAVFGAFAVGTLVSGARTSVVGSGLMFAAFLLGKLFFSKGRDKAMAAALVVFSVLLVGLFAFFFQGAIEATQTRFEVAAQDEDFWGRILWFVAGESWVVDAMTWIGAGIGYGSNLATFVRTGSSGFFPLAEAESGRILLEGGIVGLVFIALKALVLIPAVAKSVRLSARTNSPFPMLLWITAALALVTWASLAQLTANGLLGVVVTLALLIFRFPGIEIFPARGSRT